MRPTSSSPSILVRAARLLALPLLFGLAGGCSCGTAEQVDPCDPDPCNDHGTCEDGACSCDAPYQGESCDACAEGFTGYPACAPIDPCDPDPCNDHGTCAAGICSCDSLYTGTACDACLDPAAAYPDCTPPGNPCEPDPCNGHGTCSEGACTCDSPYAGPACDMCAGGLVGYPQCVACVDDGHCDAPTPACDPLTNTCVECVDDGHCAAPAPACDPLTNTCVECTATSAPPSDLCAGVCTLVPPECVAGAWVCTGPGYEPVEESCDGFDNDCDGLVDENVCAVCDVPIADLQANLFSRWDIDFDFECRTYMTTLVSGSDYTTVLAPGQAAQNYLGNSNQDMGFALVDPDPKNHRVVVTYSCLFGCNATNGLTLLYTCDPSDPTCGCAGQANCPGFLNEPFLPTGTESTSLSFGGYAVGTPTGLAAGPGNTYYVGNFRPLGCDPNPGCVECDPDHAGVVCSPSAPACCDTTSLGRLARFTLPAPGVEPTFRVVRVLAGEEIFGLTSARDGSVWVGTYAGAGQGNLYRFDPVREIATLVQSFGGAVYSITQDWKTGDFYLELRQSPKIVRLDEAGMPKALPAAVPSDPTGEGVLQVGPDRKLYRLQGAVDGNAGLEVFDLP